MPLKTPDPIATATRGRTGNWLVHSRGQYLLSYRSEANAKHLARFINELNAQVERNPEDREKLLARAEPSAFPDPTDEGFDER